ncbi:hypothetical protein [Kitasatospora camelliae]|uniref:Uncharacterized protein n=1 Tax=Kitasatospora camelliae TaxID=3156397 RepID=A0AAU8K433_9ACTN
MPSAAECFRFHFEVTGRWSDSPGATRHHDPEAAATDHVLNIIRDIARDHSLPDVVTVEKRVNARLGLPAAISDASVTVSWASARLWATPDDMASALHSLRSIHEHNLKEEQHRRELDLSRSLRDALREDPSLALAHLVLRHPQDLSTESISQLGMLVAEVSAYDPANSWVATARVLQDLIKDMPADTKAHLINQLATLASQFGHKEGANQLRRHTETRKKPTSNPADHRYGVLDIDRSARAACLMASTGSHGHLALLVNEGKASSKTSSTAPWIGVRRSGRRAS